ncbi:GNAT family N-acetyltransferase [Tabrizicola sp. J26]|nr:GNAT family N-acetyltransferase [Tabrizicola rongguiensis]
MRDLQPGDAGWIISRHGALYARDEGFDSSFEALVAEIVAGFLRRHDPARERGWIAEGQEGERLGSIFCVGEDPARPEVAKLRLFLVEPEARGTGLATTMLQACLAFARAAGYRHMRLWTHESHRAAGRLYARNGFRLSDSRPARSFGQDVVEQTWERPLT